MVAVGRGSPILDGEESGPSENATSCVPPGVTRTAFVTCGSTGRSGGGVVSSMSPELYGARITLIRLGVGVNGGGLLIALLVLLRGVTGTSGILNSFSCISLTGSVDFDFGFLVLTSAASELAARFMAG